MSKFLPASIIVRIMPTYLNFHYLKFYLYSQASRISIPKSSLEYLKDIFLSVSRTVQDG